MRTTKSQFDYPLKAVPTEVSMQILTEVLPDLNDNALKRILSTIQKRGYDLGADTRNYGCSLRKGFAITQNNEPK